MSNNNSAINKILLTLIAALLAGIGVLSYFVFFDAGEPDAVSNTIADSKGEQQEEKLKLIKKKVKADNNKVIYVMGEDGEAARRNYTNGVSVENEVKTDSTSNKNKKVLFVGNSRSGVYHYPNCSGVAKMAEHNKVELYSREEAENSGFVLHKGCPSSF